MRKKTQMNLKAKRNRNRVRSKISTATRAARKALLNLQLDAVAAGLSDLELSRIIKTRKVIFDLSEKNQRAIE